MLLGMTDTPGPGWLDDPTSPGIVRWWDGTKWTDHRQAKFAPAPGVVVNQRKAYKTSHGFHLLMTIFTLGLWGIFVWLPVGIYNAARS